MEDHAPHTAFVAAFLLALVAADAASAAGPPSGWRTGTAYADGR
jgi:hypothetical protein